MTDIDALRRLLAEANIPAPLRVGFGGGVTGPSTPTLGPVTCGESSELSIWKYGGEKGPRPRHRFEIAAFQGQTFAIVPGDESPSEPRAALIVAAVNGLPGLLDRIKSLEKALKPFARWYGYACADTVGWSDAEVNTAPVIDDLMVSDFRRAATALKGEA